jgi:hypothetical protein
LPKQAPSAHFDVAALLSAVQEQDCGLVVSTNHPAGLQRLLYDHMRAQPARRCSILQAPDSPRKFWLVKTSALPPELASNAADR